jgi:hypothetical protein
MDEKTFPEVASFLIRFVQDQPKPDGISNYRGVVRHVQTDLEQVFTSWEEVESFIQQVIPLEIIKNKHKE